MVRKPAKETGEKERERIAELEREMMVWERRAIAYRAKNQQLEGELSRLREDNATLSAKLVDLAMKPTPDPVVVREDNAPLVEKILETFRRVVSPDVVINNDPDSGSMQRAGINWTDQGLDNNGGVKSNISDPFDVSPGDIPDYVLAVEGLDPNQVKGTRGGWFNPQQPEQGKN